MKKKIYATTALLLLMPPAALAQDNGVEVTGQVTGGAQIVETTTDSSKYTEYRDIKDGFYLYDLGLNALDRNNGRFFDFQGKNVLRDDQNLQLNMGGYGSWNFGFEWDEIRHNLSNKAMTPYQYKGNGLYELPATVSEIYPAFTKELVPSAANLRANDQFTANYLDSFLHPTELRNDREKGTATLGYSLLDSLKFKLSLVNENRDGNKLTYGPIGDRPPRTLNIQFAEPIDYTVQELKFETDYLGKEYQVNFTYAYSQFENNNDTLTWQNIYTNAPGATYDAWGGATPRNVATYGSRALDPDNWAHNASLTFGIDLPKESRLTATAAYGLMQQDETLIPYSTNSTTLNGVAWNDPARLPRTAADAEMETKLFNLDYTINPIDRLNLRAFYRYYELENNTPIDQWRYATSDTVGATGSVSYKNKRLNLAYSYDKQNYGLDGDYSLGFWRSTLGLGFEREEISRDYREADTDENIYKMSLRTRPTNWLSIKAKYLYGDRDADTYNGNVTQQSYWYTAGEVSGDVDNPAATFSNHPDTRRYDVSDRKRDQFDLAATVSPTEKLDLTATYQYRKDDYDSGVTPVQPLLGTSFTGANLYTAGDQLGLLEEKKQQYGLDASYAPTDRLTLSLFANRERLESLQRSMEFNENWKQDPLTQSGKDLNGWDSSNAEDAQWMAEFDDRTNTIGLGAGYEIIPDKLRLTTDYTYSQGKVDIAYSGMGSEATTTTADAGAVALPDPANPFAFSSPPTVTHRQYNLNASLEYKFQKNLVLGLHYMYDRYKISDWQQEADTPWVDSVGSEYLLRDSSYDVSNQWGNRLVNMGTYLGPTYEAQTAFATLTYRF